MDPDREKLRALNLLELSEVRRQIETFRIEGNYHLEIAMGNLFVSRKGRVPSQLELMNIIEAVQILMHDKGNCPEPEEAVRIKYANETLDREFR
jgi:hypothetical protein